MIPPITAITLEQWREWDATATRPYTDDRIGEDPTRRRMDAANSAAISTTTDPRPRNPRPPRRDGECRHGIDVAKCFFGCTPEGST